MSQYSNVVIVGRPNVGKSTLFNRLIGKKRSLVHDLPGVTRDRIEGKAQWWSQKKPYAFRVIDTGGLGGEHFAVEIEKQVQAALREADIVLYVLDSKVGLTPADEELFRELQKSGVIKRIPLIGVVNKVDDDSHESRINDFYSLGLEELLTVSSEHGRGFDDLKQKIIELVQPEPLTEPLSDISGELKPQQDSQGQPEESDSNTGKEDLPRIPRIAIVGKPNVGKSTLLNAILGESRVITSPIAGTTVDSIDVQVTLQDRTFILVDTAGIRRKSKTEKGVEVLSVVQTRKALERADIALLVLDGEKGVTDQDEKIGGLIEEAGCSVILAVNKWDTQSRNKSFTRDIAAEEVRKTMAYLKYAPMLFMSGLRKQGIDDLGSLFDEILHQRKLKIPTHEFTEWVRTESTIHNPMNAKFYLCHQSGRNPPTFVCHVNNPEKIDFSLKRHLINALRAKWGYMGSPIRMLFTEGKNNRSSPRK